MKKVFLILFLILNAQSEVTDIKIWDLNSKIVWSDFKGEIPKNRGLKKAVTSTKIIIRSDFFEGDTPKYIIKSQFDRSKSWTITNSEKHLIHERLHFDITELYSRIIRKKLDSLSKREEKNIECYKKVYKKLLKNHLKTQENYDRESYSSEIKQKYWIDSIHSKLRQLEKYKFNFGE